MADGDSSLAFRAMRLAERMARRRRFRTETVRDAVSYAWEFAQAGKGTPYGIAFLAIRRAKSFRRFADGTTSVDHPKHRADCIREGVEIFDLASTQDDPADLAVLRVDLEAWAATLKPRTREALRLMIAGERTSEIAVALGMKPSAVAEMRARLYRAYKRLHG